MDLFNVEYVNANFDDADAKIKKLFSKISKDASGGNVLSRKADILSGYGNGLEMVAAMYIANGKRHVKGVVISKAADRGQTVFAIVCTGDFAPSDTSKVWPIYWHGNSFPAGTRPHVFFSTNTLLFISLPDHDYTIEGYGTFHVIY